MVQGGEVNPDLVRATGLQFDVEQAGGLMSFQRVVVGDALPAALHDRELPVIAPMSTDRCVDRSAGRIRMPLHQCVIALFDGALLESPLHHGVGALGEGHDHHTRCADVEAVHDALPLVNARRGDSESRTGKAAEHRRSVPADSGVGRHPGRFVDRDDVVVGVENGHALDFDGRILRRRRRFGQSHLQPCARCQPVGLTHRCAVKVDAAVFGQRSGRGAGQSEQPRQPGVDAHARQSLRHGH